MKVSQSFRGSDLRMLLHSLIVAAVLVLGGSPTLACIGTGDTEVDAIYPSVSEIPENTLRFYVYFSAPMGPGDVKPHIRLQNKDGQEIEGAFLANRFDLWSPDRSRLTLLFDPSRVKTGLEAHESMGRALRPGESYSLKLGRELKDAEGCSLAAGTSHEFTVVAADFTYPDPSGWLVDEPQANTLDPLVIQLGSSFDHLSLAYRLRITSTDGALVPGRIKLADGESVWVFYPSEPWSADVYKMNIDSALEDLAGNRPGRLFDQPAQTASEPATLTREIVITARSAEQLVK